MTNMIPAETHSVFKQTWKQITLFQYINATLEIWTEAVKTAEPEARPPGFKFFSFCIS